MRKYQDSISSANTGLPVYQAQIFLYDSDMAPVQLYSDEGVTPLAQPVLTDGLGEFWFFVADGTYFLGVADPDGSNLRYYPDLEIYEDARNVSVPVGETGIVLPSIGARMNSLAGYDADGDPTAYAVDISAIEALAGATDEMILLAANIVPIQTVATNLSGSNTIGTVAANIANVNLTGGSIANVNSVASDLTNINAVAGGLTNINTVAGIYAAVSTVAGISAAVTTVAGIAANVSTVAGIAANVTIVAGNSTNINTVAGSIANVNALAPYAAAMGVVSTNIANVNAVSADLALGPSLSFILRAPAAAASTIAAYNAALLLFNGIGPAKAFATKALAISGFAAAANNSIAIVAVDSTKSNRATRYYKSTATDPSNWIFLSYEDTAPTYYCDPEFGSDSNDGLTVDTPKQTLSAWTALGSGQTGITFALARGSRVYGQYPDFSASPWCKVISYGQGLKPTIDGGLALFTGTWVNDPTYTNLWSQTITLPHTTTGAGAGDANSWHIAMYDEALPLTDNGAGTQDGFETSWVKRVLNGDPSPDPLTYSIDKMQTTTIAVASQAALLALANTYPNSFTVFAASGGYEPRAVATTSFVVYFNPRDGSNPNSNLRTVRINEQVGLATLAKGQDLHGIRFARCGGKDMMSGFQYLPGVVPATASANDILSGAFYDCEFIEFGCHGPVVNGMSAYRSRFEGSYTRDSLRLNGGMMHNFHSLTGVHKSRGFEVIDCQFKRGGYAVYSHGGDGLNYDQHYRAVLRNNWFEDVNAVTVAGTTTQGYLVQNCGCRDASNLGSTTYPVSLYQSCKFFLRAGVVNSLGGAGAVPVRDIPHVGKLRLEDTLIVALGTSLTLPVGPLASLTLAQFPSLEMLRSTVIGNIGAQTNAFWRQLSISMDASYLGTFTDIGGTLGIGFYPTGTITAVNGSIIECNYITPATLIAQHAGIAADTETGMRLQTYTKTIVAADLSFVTIGAGMNASAFVDNGDGTATVTTTFNGGASNFSRGLSIAQAGVAGVDYVGRFVSWVSNTSIIVSPVPTSIPSAKAVKNAFYRPFPFRDPVTAYISADGLTLNMTTVDGLTVGQLIHVSNVITGQPSYGTRQVTAISGTQVTVSAACVWKQRANGVTWRAIATPTSGTGKTLPTVSVSWGFPIQARLLNDASFVQPRYSVAPVEGGSAIAGTQITTGTGLFKQPTTTVITDYDSTGAAADYVNMDYENGYWRQSFGVAVGDVVTLTSEVDVAQFRFVNVTPLSFGHFAPDPTCLLATRGIGFREAA